MTWGGGGMGVGSAPPNITSSFHIELTTFIELFILKIRHCTLGQTSDIDVMVQQLLR